MTGIWPAQWPGHDVTAGRWTSEMEVVARRVDRWWPDVELALVEHPLDAVELDAGSARFGGRFRRTGASTLTASARLYGRGLRLLRFTRVIVEVSAWADDHGELRVRPVSRGVGRWGARRQQRYFDLAHELADTLRAAVTTRSITPGPAVRPARAPACLAV